MKSRFWVIGHPLLARSLRHLRYLGATSILSACIYQNDIAPQPAHEWVVPSDPIRVGEVEPARPVAQADNDETRSIERIVEPGTGRFVSQPGGEGQEFSTSDNGDITINVIDADVREVARLILNEGLGLNYIVDPAVAGSVTIRTSRPVPADDMLSIFDSVLNLNGATLIDDDGVLKIVTLEQARKNGIETSVRSSLEADGLGYRVQIVPVRYGSAIELADLLQGFINQESVVRVNARRNSIILVGSDNQISTLVDIIEIFDVDWVEGTSFGLFPIEDASAQEVTAELEQIFHGQEDGGVPRDLLTLMPIERLNAVLVITARPDYLIQVETWIGRLDQPGKDSGEQVYVYAVQNGRAADLAAVIGQIFDVSSTSISQDMSILAPGSTASTFQSSSGSDSDDSFTDDEEFVDDEGLDIEEQQRMLSQTPNRTLSADTVSQLSPDSTGQDQLGTRIVADETNNSLVIRATAENYEKIREALRKLDVEPVQILLEATIAEVTLRDTLSYGLQWFFESGSSDITFTEGSTNSSLFRDFPGFSGLLSSKDVGLVFNALDEVSDVNVISSPQVLVLANQVATLQVGDQVPIVVQQSTDLDDSDLRVVNTIEQRQTGVILSVVPRVNANGLVVLDIQQEISDVVQTTSSDIDSPTISQRRLTTSVAVGTDQTVALGGLIQDNSEGVNSGIPYLSRLPLVGPLFGATFKETQRTELLVLMTPRVVTNQQEARAVTQDVRQRMRAITPLFTRLNREGSQASPNGIRRIRRSEQPPSADRNDVSIQTPPAASCFEDGDPKSPILKPIGSTGRYQESDVVSYYRVQVFAADREELAEQKWADVQSSLCSLLDGHDAHIEHVKKDEEMMYQLQVGKFEDFDQAGNLCRDMQRRGVDCWVVPRG